MLTRRTTGREANANDNKAPIPIERIALVVLVFWVGCTSEAAGL